MQSLSALAPVDAWYLPAAHAMHVDAVPCPVTALYLPDPQATQAPLTPYVPAAHGRQELANVAPVPVEYVPEPQAEQVAADVATAAPLHVPDAHRVQSEAWSDPVAATYLPAPQSMQTFEFDLPVPELLYLPAAHAMQTLALEYLPASQLVHWPNVAPATLVLPALHAVHACTSAVAPSGTACEPNFPIAHFVHDMEFAKASAARHLPAAQAMQSDA